MKFNFKSNSQYLYMRYGGYQGKYKENEGKNADMQEEYKTVYRGGEGEIVEKKFTSLFKDPSCYKIKNTFIALRDKDASKIEVSYE